LDEAKLDQKAGYNQIFSVTGMTSKTSITGLTFSVREHFLRSWARA